MKKLVTIVFAICIATVTFAQAQKFAHINTSDLLILMPEVSQADQALQKYGKDLDSELMVMSQEYQKKLTDFQAKQVNMAESIKQSKIKEITDLEGRIRQFEQTAQQDIVAEREKLYQPILTKVQKAIDDVAAEKKYAYVFDTSTGAVLVASTTDDIIDDVKTKLGI
jgi:outer membrane protein